MRRFFVTLFVLSIIATGGALYWRTYMPEATIPIISKSQPRSLSPGDQEAAPSARSLEELKRTPSERQDLAVTISIVSSIISAIAAVMQTWLTARAYRQ